MALSQFRRNAATEQKKRGGKGMRGNWRDRFRLPKDRPTPIMLQDFKYVDPSPDPESVEIDPVSRQPLPSYTAYFKYMKHTRQIIGQGGAKFFRDEACSAGWDPHNPQACAGCIAMDLGDKSLKRVEAYVIGLIHLAIYHTHPLYDPKKGWITKDDGTPVIVTAEHVDGSCNFCRVLSGQPPYLQQGEMWPNYDPRSIGTVFGARRYMELGSGHLSDLGEWDKQISMKCGGTKFAKNPSTGEWLRDAAGNAIPIGRCNNFLDVDGYACSQCGTMLIDCTQDPRTLPELEAIAMKRIPCPKCQRAVYAKELNSCEICGATADRGGQSKVYGLFDGVLWGQRQGENQQSHMVLAQYDLIEEFEANLSPQVRQIIGKPLKDRIAELNKEFNFDELFKPKSLQDQVKRLELNPAIIQNYGAPPPQYGGQPGYGAPPMQGGYGAPPQQYQQPYPGQVPQGQPPVPYQQQAPQQPQYQAYPQQQPGNAAPGPAPFTPPAKPNFSA